MGSHLPVRILTLVEQKPVQLLLVFIITFVAYFPSFSVPFYFDDFSSIVDNPLLRQPDLSPLWQNYGMRFIGYLSFWANVQLFEFNLMAFHSVNLGIHLLNGFLVYQLTLLLAAYFHPQSPNIKYLALLTALIWLLHPLNTQAVTYIVQRLASLVSLFYLLALISYLKLRLYNQSKTWFIGLLIAVTLGALTKQNFFTLFTLLVLFELLFMQDKFQRFVSISTVISIIAFALILLAARYSPTIQGYIDLLDSLTRENTVFSRHNYFITQLVIVAHYLAKYFYPVNLQLDMYYEITKQATYIHFSAFLLHAIIISSSVALRKTKPLICFGIIFFYTGHLVESAIAPITDLAFEHRTYLPNIGLTIALFGFLFGLNKPIKKLYYLFIAISILLSSITFWRNTQWINPEKFYARELQLSPNSPNSLSAVADIEISKGNWARSEELYRRANYLNMQQGKLTTSNVNNLMLVLVWQKKYQAALNTAKSALKYITRAKDRSITLSTLAYVHINMKRCDSAIELIAMALALDPNNQKAKEYLSYCNQQNQDKNQS